MSEMSGARFAVSADTASLKALFRDCFSDSPEDTERFFSTVYEPEKTVVFEDNGAIRAELFMIDAQIYSCGSFLKAVYIYGVCTAEAFRSRGFASALMGFAENAAREKKTDVLALVPAEKSLFEYYARHGFVPALVPTDGRLCGAENDSFEPYKTFCPDAAKVREIRLSGNNGQSGLIFCENMLKYITDFSRHGISAAGVRGADGKEAYALFELTDGKISITEVFGAKEMYSALKKEIILRYSERQLVPAAFAGLGEYAGMLKPLNKKSEGLGSVFMGQPY